VWGALAYTVHSAIFFRVCHVEGIKDIVYIVVIGGGAIVGIIRSIMRIRDNIRTHSEKLKSHEERIGRLEDQNCITDRKLDILHANVVRLLEKFKIEPVQDLFESRSVLYEKKSKNRDFE